MSQADPTAGRNVGVQKPKSNVYTVMLVLALLAIIIGCVFLYMELQEYEMQLKPVGYAGVEFIDESLDESLHQALHQAAHPAVTVTKAEYDAALLG